MSQKKKLAQAARREARKALAGYGENLNQRLAVFNELLKQRPKFIPRRVWRWFGNKFIDLDKLERTLNLK